MLIQTAHRGRKSCKIFLALTVALAATSTLLGQAAPGVADSDETVESFEPKQGILVLRNGTVVTGNISQRDGLYEVQGDQGTVQIPVEFVKLRADDRRQAYQKLHAQAAARENAGSHLMLAKWCIDNYLEDEAKFELEEALELEPGLDEAKKLRQALENPKRAENHKLLAANDQKSLLYKNWPTAKSDHEIKPLGGLSQPLALRYVRHIQPVLIKNCATAACHSRESNLDFQLHHLLRGKNPNRVSTEQNLAAVLERIESERPAKSPLLKAAQGNHAGGAKMAITGPRGARHLAELEEWVNDVARDNSDASRPVTTSKKAEVGASIERGADSRETKTSDPFAGRVAASPSPFQGQRRDRAIVDADESDPFDPADFNRRTPKR